MKILVVDDEEPIVQLIKLKLEGAGFEVQVAYDGEEALNQIEVARPDLVILDVMIPRIDGYTVCRKIRSSRETRDLPVIMLSAKTEEEDVVNGFDLGIDDYIRKPFHASEVVARVKAVLERAGRNIGTSPATGLPGSSAIAAELNRRIKENRLFASIYFDLNDFKSFNEAYGFQRADEAIKFTGRVIKEVVDTRTGQKGLVGHVGGDAFIAIVDPALADSICQEVIAVFDSRVPELYNPEDRQLGYLVSKNRQGQEERKPLMSIAVAVVSNERRKIQSDLEVGKISAELIKYAKTFKGSVYVKDRRTR